MAAHRVGVGYAQLVGVNEKNTEDEGEMING